MQHTKHELLAEVRALVGHSIGQQLDAFELPQPFRFTHSILSRLAFIESYEAYLDVSILFLLLLPFVFFFLFFIEYHEAYLDVSILFLSISFSSFASFSSVLSFFIE